MTLLPSDLLAMVLAGIVPAGSVAYDTETSGLFADDGARVSTVSIAFEVGDGMWQFFRKRRLIQPFERGCADSEFAPDRTALIYSVAWPFDQGTSGKDEERDQPTLWPEADNLDQEEWRALLEFLYTCGDQVGLTTHHGKFDNEKIRVGCRRWPGIGVELDGLLVWDTQNVNHLLWPLEKTSLKPTCARLFGAGMEDESAKVKAYLKKAKLPAGRWDLMPWEIVGPYADMDARLTKMLELRQQYEISNGVTWIDRGVDGLRRPGEPEAHAAANLDWAEWSINRRLETTGVLYRMERRGLPYDEAGSLAAAQECLNRAKPLADSLPFEPTDTKAKEYFFGDPDKKTSRGAKQCGLTPYALTEQGGISMTAEVLGRMVEDQVPWAAKWAEYRKITNAASMWYQAYAERMGPDGRLRTCFRQNGTVSTRFSVERVNLQAIPQDYRLEGFGALDGIPTPRQLIASGVPQGWRIYELDLAQAELRVAAMFAKCEPMLAMIRDGADLHAYTTRNLFPQIEEGSDDWFKYRQVGKRANFSLGFRAQGQTFKKMVSKETGIVLEDWQADKIVRDWNALFPEFARANTRHENVVAARQSSYGRGWVEFINGERRWYSRWDDASSAFNQRVQGNLAQFGIDWMIRTDKFLSNGPLDLAAKQAEIGEAGLVLTIHDSQVLLLPDDSLGETLAATCAGLGRDLWLATFPDVPGDVDFHGWERG